MKRGTVSPRPFQNLACRECQAGGPLVPCSARGALPCQLLQQWGSQVSVGRCVRVDRTASSSMMGDVDCVNQVHVLIDRGSMVGNPFVGGSHERLTKAFDELLHVLLTDDLNYDELALQFPQLADEPSFGVTGAEPMERRLLHKIATTHGVLLHEAHAGRFRILALRAWIAFHAQRLRLGCSLKLLCHCMEGPAPPWTCHGQGLAGALVWVAVHCCWSDRRVRLLLKPTLPFSLILAPSMLSSAGGTTLPISQHDVGNSFLHASSASLPHCVSPPMGHPFGCGPGPCTVSTFLGRVTHFSLKGWPFSVPIRVRTAAWLTATSSAMGLTHVCILGAAYDSP